MILVAVILIVLVVLAALCAGVIFLVLYLIRRKNNRSQPEIDIVKTQQQINRLRSLVMRIDRPVIKKSGDSVTDRLARVIQVVKENRALTIEDVTESIKNIIDLIDRTTTLTTNYITIKNDHIDEAERILIQVDDLFNKTETETTRTVSILKEYSIGGIE
jgi:hypothetical protein